MALIGIVLVVRVRLFLAGGLMEGAGLYVSGSVLFVAWATLVRRRPGLCFSVTLLSILLMLIFQFLRQELHYEGGYERRQKAFHRDDDMHISVRELWEIWIRSEVHNWTADQTADWLVHFVQLPQYVPNFQMNGIDGTKLPR